MLVTPRSAIGELGRLPLLRSGREAQCSETQWSDADDRPVDPEALVAEMDSAHARYEQEGAPQVHSRYECARPATVHVCPEVTVI